MIETETLDGQLRLKALADQRLTGMIGNRWGVMLDTVPCVTVQQISGVPEYSHDGDSGLEACRYQIGMHTSCVFDAIKIMAHVKRIFSGFKGNLGAAGEGAAVVVRVVNSMQHGKQPGVNLFYSTVDLAIQWSRDLEA